MSAAVPGSGLYLRSGTGQVRPGADGLEARTAVKFEVAFVDQVGTSSQEPLLLCWSQPFERCRPVRSFSSYRGRRSGLWWFSGTGLDVGYESCLNATMERISAAWNRPRNDGSCFREFQTTTGRPPNRSTFRAGGAILSR